MKTSNYLVQKLGQTGQVESLQNLETLINKFEEVLGKLGIKIKSGSELEAACCFILELNGGNPKSFLNNPRSDIRPLFGEVLGIWIFLQKIVRLQSHRSFASFAPHLSLLNKGTVVQNKNLRVSQDATNKIFELLFALALLDVSDEVILDHPDLAMGDNPDILAKIDGKCWGFACKTLYSDSAKSLFDTIKRGVQQIEVAPQAEVGVVVVNLRNLIHIDDIWPILNRTQLEGGTEPIYAAYSNPTQVLSNLICNAIELKRNAIVQEIGFQHVIDLFSGKKALPAFLTFCQTCTGKDTTAGPIPTSILTLGVGTFSDTTVYAALFEKINCALHERSVI